MYVICSEYKTFTIWISLLFKIDDNLVILSFQQFTHGDITVLRDKEII